MICKPSRRGSAFVLMLLLPLVVWARGGAWADQLTATWVAGSSDETRVLRRANCGHAGVIREVGITGRGA
jgi:hypothetical protein